MTSLIPPRYVNISAALTYSNELSDPLFRTYSRLVGLAWRDGERRTHVPALSLPDLATICHLKPRAARLHLKTLIKQQLIECNGDQNAFRIRIVEPPVQSFALPAMAKQQPLSQPVQNFALAGTARDNLETLTEFGVNPDVQDAHRVAALPHVTPDLIRAWGQELSQRPDTRNLPGRLLYILSTTNQAPRIETRGGDRTQQSEQTSNEPEAPDQLSLLTLPDDILADLERLGWAGSYDEVATMFRDDPELVSEWLAYWLGQVSSVSNAAGAFRESLRSGRRPPRKQKRGRYDDEYSISSESAMETEPEPRDPALVKADEYWQAVLGELKLQMTSETFNTWLKPTRIISYENGIFVVSVENDYIKDWLTHRLMTTIQRTVKSVVGDMAEGSPQVMFVTKAELAQGAKSPDNNVGS